MSGKMEMWECRKLLKMSPPSGSPELEMWKEVLERNKLTVLNKSWSYWKRYPFLQRWADQCILSVYASASCSVLLTWNLMDFSGQKPELTQYCGSHCLFWSQSSVKKVWAVIIMIKGDIYTHTYTFIYSYLISLTQLYTNIHFCLWIFYHMFFTSEWKFISNI